MSAFAFDSAILRLPGRSVIDGLRDDRSAVPDYDGVLGEQAAYIAALRAIGLDVDVLPALEAFPDSMFVEDPALVLTEGAILLRPGAPSRAGEVAEIRPAILRHFEEVRELPEGEDVDGGDVLVTPNAVFIGLSKRTSRVGAEALALHLAAFGYTPRIVATPDGVLHLKTAVSLLAEDTVFATREIADSGLFAGFEVVVAPEGEAAAANALRVHDVVFIGEQYPLSCECLARKGFTVTPLSVGEVAKLDAGLSCMSLRWKRAAN